MNFNSLVQNPTGTTLYDPLGVLEGLKEPSCVRPEQSPYLLKLLLARLPQNRKMELSLHLYPKALDLMDHHNLWGMLKPFVPLWFKYQNSVLKDPLLTPYEIYNPLQNFSFLKLLLARLPICDRAKVASPLLVLAIGFMHQTLLWYEISPFNSNWSTLKSSSSMELKSNQSSELQVHGSSRDAQQYNRIQASMSSEELQIGSRKRRISQVSNVSTHYDITDNDVQPPKQSCNSSCAHLENLLFSTNCSDMAIPIEPIDTQHFLMTFD